MNSGRSAGEAETRHGYTAFTFSILRDLQQRMQEKANQQRLPVERLWEAAGFQLLFGQKTEEWYSKLIRSFITQQMDLANTVLEQLSSRQKLNCPVSVKTDTMPNLENRAREEVEAWISELASKAIRGPTTPQPNRKRGLPQSTLLRLKDLEKFPWENAAKYAQRWGIRLNPAKQWLGMMERSGLVKKKIGRDAWLWSVTESGSATLGKTSPNKTPRVLTPSARWNRFQRDLKKVAKRSQELMNGSPRY